MYKRQILGISYLSVASIAIGVEFPKETKCAVWVTVPTCSEMLCFQSGALRLHHTLPWVYSLPWRKTTSLTSFDTEMYKKTPLIEAVPEELGCPWSEMLEEGPSSRFWQENDLWDYVRKIAVPGLHFGGWFDFLLDSTLEPYREMRKSGAPQRLILGPWSHNGVVGNAVSYTHLDVYKRQHTVHVESVVLLSHKRADSLINVKMEYDDDIYRAPDRVTYKPVSYTHLQLQFLT